MPLISRVFGPHCKLRILVFFHRFMVRALRAWAINRWKNNSVRNLQYGPKTRLIRGIYSDQMTTEARTQTQCSWLPVDVLIHKAYRIYHFYRITYKDNLPWIKRPIKEQRKRNLRKQSLRSFRTQSFSMSLTCFSICMRSALMPVDFLNILIEERGVVSNTCK